MFVQRASNFLRVFRNSISKSQQTSRHHIREKLHPLHHQFFLNIIHHLLHLHFFFFFFFYEYYLLSFSLLDCPATAEKPDATCRVYHIHQNATGTSPGAERFRVDAFREFLRRRTCHSECRLGCYKEQSDKDCVACRHVRLDGRCLPECPKDMLVVCLCLCCPRRREVAAGLLTDVLVYEYCSVV